MSGRVRRSDVRWKCGSCSLFLLYLTTEIVQMGIGDKLISR